MTVEFLVTLAYRCNKTSKPVTDSFHAHTYQVVSLWQMESHLTTHYTGCKNSTFQKVSHMVMDNAV